MKTIYRSILLVILAAFSVTAHAEKGEGEFLNAIVEIRISVPENARTAERFGTNRVASGVVIDKTGHVLTIGFQTIEAEKAEIVVKGRKRVEAIVVGYDRNTGFGLLRANSPLQVTPMPFGSSAEVKKGDPIIAASYGGKDAVQGVMVVARKEFAGPWEYLLENGIFTSPPIVNFSGSALINRNGRLVGIGYLLSQLMIDELWVIQTNMFVPIDLLKPILSDFKLSGSSKLPLRPWLGVRTEELYGRLIVERVISGSPSEKAGIKPVILSFPLRNRMCMGWRIFTERSGRLAKQALMCL